MGAAFPDQTFCRRGLSHKDKDCIHDLDTPRIRNAVPFEPKMDTLCIAMVIETA